MVLTGRGNKVQLVVRCACQSGYVRPPNHWYNWHKIAIVDTLDQVRQVWAWHLQDVEHHGVYIPARSKTRGWVTW